MLVGINCLNIVLYISVKAYYTLRNKKREKIWDKMTLGVRSIYLVLILLALADDFYRREIIISTPGRIRAARDWTSALSAR